MKIIFSFLMIFGFLFGSNFYLVRQFYRGISAFFPNFSYIPLIIAVIILNIFVFSVFAGSIIPRSLADITGGISLYWMGIFLYLLIFFFCGDIITLILKLFKAGFVKLPLYRGISFITVIALTLITVIYGLCHARGLNHISYEVTIEGKKDISDINIIMLSDIHIGAIGSESRLPLIVEEINSKNPDIVCIAGDIFDTDYRSVKNPGKAIETLKGIKSTYGVYACLGNHDAGNTHNEMINFLKDSNITLLKDEYTVIDNRLVLAGRLDSSPIGSFSGLKRKPFCEVIKDTDSSLPVIVMDHNPKNIREYTNADLIFSGHTHRGQLFPMNFVTNLMFEVDYGYKKADDSSPHVIVTSGAGYWGMPMRVGTDCEIVSVKIR